MQSVEDITSDLIGKPYKKGGLGPLFYDCFGLASKIRFRAGLGFPTHQLGDIRNTARFLQKQKLQAEKLLYPTSYCVVMFRMCGKFITHIGIVLPSLYKFIHIVEDKDVCIERLDAVLWRNKIEGYYEFPTG